MRGRGMEDAGPPRVAAGRYQALDGLRGFAALAVAIFHVRPLVSPWFPGGYLAVDVFFCLSGFVIAHAYDGKLASGMGVGAFARVRLVRLWPMYMVGAALGAILALVLEAKAPATPAAQLTAMIGLSFVFLPSWGTSFLFPFDWPAWSLFLELAINGAHAAFFRRLTTRRLAILVALSGVGIAADALLWGTTNGGVTWGTWKLGVLRVIYGFFLGVLIYRCRRRLPVIRAPGLAVAAAMLIAMEVAPPRSVHGLYDAAFVLIGAPLIVLIGSQAAPWRGAAALGQLSYPLYAIHWPLVALAGVATGDAVGARLAAAVAAVPAAWFLARRVDGPARARLSAALARPPRVAEADPAGTA